MGNPIIDKNSQVVFLKQRLNMFLEVLDNIEPENTELEDIDRLIDMIDDLESKCREFSHREVEQRIFYMDPAFIFRKEINAGFLFYFGKKKGVPFGKIGFANKWRVFVNKIQNLRIKLKYRE